MRETTNKPQPLKFLVFTSKPAFMQRVLECANDNYTSYIKGTSTIDAFLQSAPGLVADHGICLTKLDALKMRKKGRAASRIFLYQSSDHSDKIYWFIFSNGTQKSLSPDSNWLSLSESDQQLDFDYWLLTHIPAHDFKKAGWQWKRMENTQTMSVDSPSLKNEAIGTKFKSSDYGFFLSKKINVKYRP